MLSRLEFEVNKELIMTEEKYVYDDLNQPPVDEGFNSSAVATHGGNALAAPGEKGSLPVLEAFQEFLEEERKRSRNRMLILSAVFTLLLLCVIFFGLFIGAVYLNRMKSELNQVKHNSETELLRIQNETLRAMSQSGAAPMPILNNSGMSEGQKAQVALMMQESQKEIAALQAKIEELQKKSPAESVGPDNLAISNALVKVMREVYQMRKQINSGASPYTPIKRPESRSANTPAVEKSLKVTHSVAPSVPYEREVAPELTPVAVPDSDTLEASTEKVVDTDKIIASGDDGIAVPSTVPVTIKPDDSKKGIVCALPMEL